MLPAPRGTSHADRCGRRACRFQRRRITGSVCSSRAQARDISQASARHLAGVASGLPALCRFTRQARMLRTRFGAASRRRGHGPRASPSGLRVVRAPGILRLTIRSSGRPNRFAIGSPLSSRVRRLVLGWASARSVLARPRQLAARHPAARAARHPSAHLFRCVLSREQFAAGAGTKHRHPGCVRFSLRASCA